MNNKKAGKSPEEEKIKISTSLYFSLGTIEDLDECLFSVKKRLPVGKRAKLSKSVFCETALRIAIDEYNRNGEKSMLWKDIHELFN